MDMLKENAVNTSCFWVLSTPLLQQKIVILRNNKLSKGFYKVFFNFRANRLENVIMWVPGGQWANFPDISIKYRLILITAPVFGYQIRNSYRPHTKTQKEGNNHIQPIQNHIFFHKVMTDSLARVQHQQARLEKVVTIEQNQIQVKKAFYKLERPESLFRVLAYKTRHGNISK